MAIFKCNCEHEYQDKKYGKGNRVFNSKKGTPLEYRCTVCERIRGVKEY